MVPISQGIRGRRVNGVPITGRIYGIGGWLMVPISQRPKLQAVNSRVHKCGIQAAGEQIPASTHSSCSGWQKRQHRLKGCANRFGDVA
eukprot:363696-Chlamydomonas_euryale.AAC.17